MSLKLQKAPNITPVILAGGHGLRLRPLSSSKRPKPFLKVLSKHSFLQNTIRRASYLNSPIIICGKAYKNNALKHAHSIGISPLKIMSEPNFKSTAPAIALAAFMLAEDDAYMLIMPSDHWMNNHIFAPPNTPLQDNEVLIYGAPARIPSSRYGYIKTDAENMVQEFIEKPDKNAAHTLIKNNNVFWNTGIFQIKAQTYLNLLQHFAPEIYHATKKAYTNGTQNDAFFTPCQKAFSQSPNISVDHAIMEHLPHHKNITARVAPLHTQWHDIGCFPDLCHVQIKRLINLFKLKKR